jgi:hypothetical protein
MPEKEIPVLTDKQIPPTHELLSAILGERIRLWEQIVSTVKMNNKDITEVWRYYNDGKRWLFRLMQKKKTICWVGVYKGSFNVSFYFGDKAEPVIEGSDLSDQMKSDFRNAKRYNNFRGITLEIKEHKDVDMALKFTDIKLKLK